jgi:hypothetical protein
LADYHGTGRLDLLSGASCCQHPFGFYVFPRSADGKFAASRRVNLRFPKEEFGGDFDLPANGLQGQTRVAVADWNGDGVPDLFVLIPTRMLGIAYGPLAGKDELTVQRLWPKGAEPVQLTDMIGLCVTDWDGDGLLDLVIGCTSAVYWCRNAGTKQAAARLEGPRRLVATTPAAIRSGVGVPGSNITGIAVADWNGNGRPDLIVSRIDYQKAANGLQPERNQVWLYLRKDR